MQSKEGSIFTPETVTQPKRIESAPVLASPQIPDKQPLPQENPAVFEPFPQKIPSVPATPERQPFTIPVTVPSTPEKVPVPLKR